jgi:hypothetical protein
LITYGIETSTGGRGGHKEGTSIISSPPTQGYVMLSQKGETLYTGSSFRAAIFVEQLFLNDCISAIPTSREASTLFRITRHIWQGRFASPDRLEDLRRCRISHILNVSDSPSPLSESDGPFQRIIWHPIEDLVRIPTEAAIQCVVSIHACVCEPESNLYVHCLAGWNRSPTVLWLYLIGCGMPADTAKNLIAKASWDAVPAHPKLIDDRLVASIREYGVVHFLPHPRPSAMEPP